MNLPSLVHVVDDDAQVRDSLAWLLDSVGIPSRTWADGAGFLGACHAGMSGCLVLDMRMPKMGGMAILERLREQGCTLPVIVVTAHADVPLAVRAMKAGAFDFIEKPYNDELMLERIQAALSRENHRHRNEARIGAQRKRFDALTARERQVLDLVIRGESNKGIARALGISIKTVELHRANLMHKTGARSATELVRLAVLAGLGGD